MPELPDITVYLECLRLRVQGKMLRKITLLSPFLLRTVNPALTDFEGKTIRRLSRLGKRIVWELDQELYLILHLMIAGRLHWKAPGSRPAGKTGLAAFDFTDGTLTLTEAGTKKRAALFLVRGKEALREHDPRGLDTLSADLEAFTAVLRRENHTLKRALTDPHLFDGIGNAYSDEILHAARLSPLALTRRLAADEIARLYQATRQTLHDWIDRLRGGWRPFSGEGDGLSSRHGGTWPI